MFVFKKVFSYLVLSSLLSFSFFTFSHGSVCDVSITDDGFIPSPATIGLGDTVSWTNNGSSPHTTTSLKGLWDSDTLFPGQSFSFVFDNNGSFPYCCALSLGMIGTINVKTTDVNNETENAECLLKFNLFQNYPNPFNPITQINFNLPKESHVKLEIYNLIGQKVATIVDRQLLAGKHHVEWNGANSRGKFVPSGIYFYRIQVGEFEEVKKMVILK